MFSVLWVLEQLLQKENKEDNSSRTGHEWIRKSRNFFRNMMKTVFKLSDAFPLFTFYLWRLGILLNSVDIGIVGNDSLP